MVLLSRPVASSRTRPMTALFAGAALMNAAMSTASGVSTIVVGDRLGTGWGGLASTAGVAGTGIGALLLTRLAVRRGSLRSGYLAATAGGAVAVAAVATGDVAALVLGMLLLGLGNAAAQLSRYAAADLHPDDRRGRAIGVIVWAGTVGAVGGPLLLAPAESVAERLGLAGLTGPFLLALAATALAAAVSTRSPSARAASPGTPSPGTPSAGAASGRAASVGAASGGAASAGAVSAGAASGGAASGGTASVGTASVGTASVGTASPGAASGGAASAGAASASDASGRAVPSRDASARDASGRAASVRDASGNVVPARRPAVTPPVRSALAVMTTGQVVMVAVMTAAPLDMHRHGHGLAAIGAALSAHTLGMFALSPLTGRLVDRVGARPVMLGGLAALVLAAAAAAMAPEGSTGARAAALFLLGYAWNLCFVGGSGALARDLPPADRARVEGSVDAAVWGAAGIASLASTAVLAAGGYGLLAAGSALLVLVPAAVLLAGRSSPASGP